jgi:hypothetical protein
VSTAAAGASSEAEFFGRLADAQVLVRQRCSSRNPGEITGYAVTLPGDTARGGGPVWFGGGKLAADLTWPKLRARWAPASTQPDEPPFTVQERNAIWEHAAQAAAEASAHIRSLAAASPVSAADAAWATADTLHAAAAALGSRTLHEAADSYDRAGRAAYGRTPRPTPAGNSLRQAARLLAKAGAVGGGHMLTQVRLIAQLAALAEAVISLRHASGTLLRPPPHAGRPSTCTPPHATTAHHPGTHAANRDGQHRANERAWISPCHHSSSRPCRPHLRQARQLARPTITKQATRPNPITHAARSKEPFTPRPSPSRTGPGPPVLSWPRDGHGRLPEGGVPPDVSGQLGRRLGECSRAAGRPGPLARHAAAR